MATPDYQKLYLQMFNKLTDGIAQLQQIQQEAEELYIQQTEPAVPALKVISSL